MSDRQAIELYAALVGDRQVMLLAEESAKRLECGILDLKYRERIRGLEVAMKKLAQVCGLHVCPKCLRIGVLTEFPLKECPDLSSTQGYYCDWCGEEAPFEWARRG